MCFPNNRKYIGIGQNQLKNIGISDIGKNQISCIPTQYLNGKKVCTLNSLNSFLNFKQEIKTANILALCLHLGIYL